MKTLISQAGSVPRIAEVPDPQPQAGEIAIAVEAAAVNPADLMVASDPGVREAFALPASVGLGWDAAGTVTAIGSRVTGLAVGDRVAVLHDDLSAPARSHADHVVVPAAATASIPAGLTTEEAASVPLNALTARQALDLLGAPDGRRLLVTGAAGALGGYAIALAAADGWQVDGLARDSDREFVESTGAQLVTGPAAASYDAMLDAAALGDVTPLHDGGAYISVRGDTSDRGRDIRSQAIQVRADGAALADLLARSATGELRPRIATSFPLTDHARAYDAAARRGLRGRVLLVP